MPRDVWAMRLQPRCRGDDLVVRASATRAGVDGDRFALVENGCDRIEVFVTWANDRTPRMNGIRGFPVQAALATSAGTTSTATPRFVSAAWQAATVLRRACSGVTIISQ